MTETGGWKTQLCSPSETIKLWKKEQEERWEKYIYIYIFKKNPKEATVQTSIINTVAQAIIFNPDARLQKPKERGMAWVKSSHWEKKGSLVEMCSELSSMRKW